MVSYRKCYSTVSSIETVASKSDGTKLQPCNMRGCKPDVCDTGAMYMYTLYVAHCVVGDIQDVNRSPLCMFFIRNDAPRAHSVTDHEQGEDDQ